MLFTMFITEHQDVFANVLVAFIAVRLELHAKTLRGHDGTMNGVTNGSSRATTWVGGSRAPEHDQDCR